jgi:acyl-CoA synthetase (AMP-forming)/AMP-acid ligase II
VTDPVTLAALLPDAVAAPDAVAVHLGEARTTRRELAAAADDVSARVRAAGVQPGQAVAVMLPNGPALVAALFAVWQAGAAYVPVNPRATDTERARMLDLVRPAAVVRAGDRDDGWEVEPLADPTPVGEGVALVQFTSGTTGPPRPVPLEHTAVLRLLDGVLGTLRGRSASRGGRDDPAAEPMPNLVPVSLSLWAGIYQVLFAFRQGAAVVLMERFEPRELARLVAEHQIRSVVLPPAAMAMLADDPAVTSLAPLRYVRSITAPLSPLQARRFVDRFGVAVLNCYGQTELGGEIVGWTAADWREFGTTKLGAVGRPHAGVEVRADADGELVVRTPGLDVTVTSPELGARLTADGWFRTGDLGRVDEDGFVWIDGRRSDMVNRGGLKVFPAEVEEVLRLADAVDDVAVVGVPDERLGQVPWAFVVPASGARVDPVALEALAREHLAPYKVPVEFRAVDALPRNDIGKVVARDLVARARPGGDQ